MASVGIMSRRGLATLREGPTRTARQPGDTGEEQLVMMLRKKHVVDGRWATQSRSVIEKKSKKLQKKSTASCVEPPGARSRNLSFHLISFHLSRELTS
jgi:hypothetical protein